MLDYGSTITAAATSPLKTKPMDIFPEKFFNISQPDTPIVQIQVRTKIKESESGRIDDDNDWTEVHLEPGMTNYFNTMTVEDASGMQRVVITFFDKNFANIEDTIVRSLVATKDANVLATGSPPIQDNTGYFEFKVDNQVMTNIRIRFGYSEVTQGSQDFIDDTSFAEGSEYSNRMDANKTVVRSPWIYLQMIGTKFDLRDEGLFVEITAFSVIDSFISKAKLLRRFAVLIGTPEEVLTSLGNIIVESAGAENFAFEFTGEKPIIPTTEGADGDIRINLGSEPNDTRRSWRTIRSVLSEVMSKIPPKNYGEDDTSEDGDESESLEKVSKSISYGYAVRQEVLTTGKLKTTLEFRYPDPIVKVQDNMRTYIWKEYGKSIVKNLNISSQIDFASLNAQILTVSPDGEQVNLHVARPKSLTGTLNSESDTKLGSVKDVTEALNKEDYSFTFVSDTIGVDGGGQSTVGARIAANVVKNLNDGVFKGSITIPGDPFYLFDNKLSPYQYLIKIIVQRPGYIDSNNQYQGTSVSYLSGIYGVSKITHTINASGFNTVLEVVRWPIEG